MSSFHESSASASALSNHEFTGIDANQPKTAPETNSYEFVFIRVHLSRRSFGEGDFVIGSLGKKSEKCLAL